MVEGEVGNAEAVGVGGWGQLFTMGQRMGLPFHSHITTLNTAGCHYDVRYTYPCCRLLMSRSTRSRKKGPRRSEEGQASALERRRRSSQAPGAWVEGRRRV